MDNNKLLSLIGQFTHITILEIDREGNILNTVFNTKTDLNTNDISNIKELFCIQDRERVNTMLEMEVDEPIKYMKLSTKTNIKGYVDVKVREMEGRTYLLITFEEGEREREIKYYSRLTELQEKAEIDSLTGLLNRHGYWERVKRILNCGDEERKIGILLIDMDGLKKINDEKGHQVGDKAIRQVGDLIVKSIRPRDIAIRYGGDEFVIVVEELTGKKSTGHGLAKRLLKEINENKKSFLSTVSIGVHVVKVGDINKGNMSEEELRKSWDGAVEVADKMAYKAKENGKNTVIFSKEI